MLGVGGDARITWTRVVADLYIYRERMRYISSIIAATHLEVRLRSGVRVDKGAVVASNRRQFALPPDEPLQYW